MTKVITYGTYDMLHYGHVRLLERAKALGDYLIVGVTSDDFDKARGKINIKESLAERVAGVRATGLADQIIIEEYEGQKIDDIRRYGVDIFTVGSDWIGRFDYLKEFCNVVYLERTEGVSSTALRSSDRQIKLGLFGAREGRILSKYCSECRYVNGLEVAGICTPDQEVRELHAEATVFETYDELLDASDAAYIISRPELHYQHVKKALERGKHALVEMPITLDSEECGELYRMARERNLILMPAIKTAYSTAYNRLLLLLKSGKIGRVVSVDATCTSLREVDPTKEEFQDVWNSLCAWGPTAMLPIFHILGCAYKRADITSLLLEKSRRYDAFTKIDFLYDDAIASIKVGRGVKSEGELIVSGTQGYLYVPAPWWKTDYFEIRYENAENNRRYFYQLDGEGIRYELVAFVKAIASGTEEQYYISEEVATSISQTISLFYSGKFTEIQYSGDEPKGK